MKTLTTLGVALVAVALAAGAEEKTDKKDAVLDPAKLVGEWAYVSGTRAGEKVDQERLAGKITITKDQIEIPAGPDAKFIIAYKINTKASPATIDMDIKDGPVKEGKALGIVSLKGDELQLCYVNIDGEDAKRPAKFESTKDNKAFYFTLKRAK
jgi:uncharacterized protein (TIGR03067 family)